MPASCERRNLPPPPLSCVQAFFLEDVLVQTDYLKEIGADTGGGGGGKGLLGGSGVEELEAAGADSYDCALCGKSGFRCVFVSVLVAYAPNSPCACMHSREMLVDGEMCRVPRR